MLLRPASHGITTAITLDFLIPRTVLRRRSSQVPSTYALPAKLNGRKHASSKSTQPSTSSSSSASSSPLTPGAFLPKPDKHVEQRLATLTQGQMDVFQGAIPELRVALGRKDLRKAREVWSRLKEKNLVAFLGPAQYDVCSRAIDSLSLSGPPQDEALLHDIALVCAVGGSINGLRALMLSAVKEGKPRVALALYEQYVSRLCERDVLHGDGSKTPTEVAADEATSTDDSSSPLLGTVRDGILCAAIAAHARLGSFADAFQTYIKANTRIASTTTEETTRRLQPDHHLCAQVNSYVRRLSVAGLLARPPTLMKHLSNLTRDSADISLEQVYTTAITGASGPDPWLAISPSQLQGTRVVLLPDFFWASFLTSFLECRRTDLAEKLWDDMLKLKIKPTIAVWNALLDGYGNIRSLSALLTTWRVMSAQGVKPDALSYRAVISAFFKVDQVDAALQRFHDFERDYLKNGVRAGDSGVLSVYNTTLHGLLFASREEDAKAIKQKMEDSGPKPDIVTYNTFLRHYGRKGDLKAMAQVLQELEPAGVKADVYTFSTLLSSLLKTRPDAHRIVLNFMKKQGVPPDTTALTAIIDHQLQECTPQQFRTAMDLLAKMERGEFEDAQPNSITYTSVLTAINRGDWLERQVVEEYNRRIWDTMQSKGLQPNRATYNVLLKTSLRNGEPEGLENAMRYYRDMVRHRVHISSDTWFILLKGLVDRKQWDVAGEIVKDMQRHMATSPTYSLQRLVERVSRRNGMRTARS